MPDPHITAQQGQQNELHLFQHKLPLNLSPGFENVNEKTTLQLLHVLEATPPAPVCECDLAESVTVSSGSLHNSSFHTFLQQKSYRSKEHFIFMASSGQDISPGHYPILS